MNLLAPSTDFYEKAKATVLQDAAERKITLSAAELEQITKSVMAANEPTATSVFDIKELDNVPVFAADDVAIYVNTLPSGTKMADVVSSMAPPFDKFFIEFQNVHNQKQLYKLNAWGALITATSDDKWTKGYPEDDGKPRWILYITIFFEREKGKPFGPVGHCTAGLAEDGTWFRHAAGEPWWGGGLVDMSIQLADEVKKEYADYIAGVTFPALMTLSFQHCKNVTIKPIEPDDKLSTKHARKYGTRLTPYHVLEITPIKRLIDKLRQGEASDLRRALHICRGHFKTFTQDAPLFGKYTGKFWWPSQVKGSQDRGLSLKDYRVTAPSEIGKAYQEANENPPDSEKQAPPSKDPDSLGRGLAAHNKTQNHMAKVVSEMGWLARSPKANEPEFDLAWKANDTLYVCEVKSLTSSNEERQLRMAIGQVIRYRQKLNSLGHEPVMAVIAAEAQPTDKSWADLCNSENILLVWPEVASERLKSHASAVMI